MDKAEFLAGLLKGLTQYTNTLAANDDKGFTEHYDKIRGDPKHLKQSLDVASLAVHAPKNRYRNVLAYDHSRVVLKDGQVGDYINGNRIPGFKNLGRYIATQGPVPTSIGDFWRMVWQENVSTIVKVTREVESGVLKCHRYWPDPHGEPPQKTVVLGGVTITHLEHDQNDVFVTRNFKISKDGVERELAQYSYEAWPDHGVPLTTKQFLDFRAAVKKTTDASKGPVVVHCSAGVGRTGTYITVDRILDAVASLTKSKDLDVDSVVFELRMHRMLMVQTQTQFQFCYKAVLDGIRMMLNAQNVATLSRAHKEFVNKDAEEAKEREVIEEKELGNVTQEAEHVTTTEEDIRIAQDEWNQTADPEYDVDRTLDTIESRFQSLTDSGKLDMTKASGAQIRLLVEAGKRLDAMKKAKWKKRQAQKKEKKQGAQRKAEQEKQQESRRKSTEKAAGKANKFLSGMK